MENCSSSYKYRSCGNSRSSLATRNGRPNGQHIALVQLGDVAAAVGGGQIVGERGTPLERDFLVLGLLIGVANAQH
jgi:hypothetical protein